jgi:hypothetical protein
MTRANKESPGNATGGSTRLQQITKLRELTGLALDGVLSGEWRVEDAEYVVRVAATTADLLALEQQLEREELKARNGEQHRSNPKNGSRRGSEYSQTTTGFTAKPRSNTA